MGGAEKVRILAWIARIMEIADEINAENEEEASDQAGYGDLARAARGMAERAFGTIGIEAYDLSISNGEGFEENLRRVSRDREEQAENGTFFF